MRRKCQSTLPQLCPGCLLLRLCAGALDFVQGSFLWGWLGCWLGCFPLLGSGTLSLLLLPISALLADSSDLNERDTGKLNPEPYMI